MQAILAALQAALSILNIIGAMRKQADPTVSNAAITNSAAMIHMVTPIVQATEAFSQAGVDAGHAPMTGVEKLAVVQSTVQSVHQAATDAGHTSDTFDSWWNQINPVITAVCAANKSDTRSQMTAGG